MKTLMPLFAVALTAALLIAPIVTAQTAPSGSCLLPNGQWCWPIAPLTYGDPCDCQMPDGSIAIGTVQ